MDKSLIFYQNDIFKKKFDLIKNKKIIFFKSNDAFQIMKGGIYNPPFFKYLVYDQPKNKVDIEIAWNSTLINGYLIIPESFSKFLKITKNIKLLKSIIKIIVYIINLILMFLFFMINIELLIFVIGVEKEVYLFNEKFIKSKKCKYGYA